MPRAITAAWLVMPPRMVSTPRAACMPRMSSGLGLVPHQDRRLLLGRGRLRRLGEKTMRPVAAPGLAARPVPKTSRGAAGSICGCRCSMRLRGSIRSSASSRLIAPALARSTAMRTAARPFERRTGTASTIADRPFSTRSRAEGVAEADGCRAGGAGVASGGGRAASRAEAREPRLAGQGTRPFGPRRASALRLRPVLAEAAPAAAVHQLQVAGAAGAAAEPQRHPSCTTSPSPASLRRPWPGAGCAPRARSRHAPWHGPPPRAGRPDLRPGLAGLGLVERERVGEQPPRRVLDRPAPRPALRSPRGRGRAPWPKPLMQRAPPQAAASPMRRREVERTVAGPSQEAGGPPQRAARPASAAPKRTGRHRAATGRRRPAATQRTRARRRAAPAARAPPAREVGRPAAVGVGAHRLARVEADDRVARVADDPSAFIAVQHSRESAGGNRNVTEVSSRAGPLGIALRPEPVGPALALVFLLRPPPPPRRRLEPAVATLPVALVMRPVPASLEGAARCRTSCAPGLRAGAAPPPGLWAPDQRARRGRRRRLLAPASPRSAVAGWPRFVLSPLRRPAAQRGACRRPVVGLWRFRPGRRPLIHAVGVGA